MKRRVGRLCLLWLLLSAIASCSGFLSTPIGEIVENSREYAGKHVTISGDVTDVFSFFVIKCFTVRDDTGELMVVGNKPLPRKNTHIKVRGMVQEAFSIGDRQLLVLIEDEEKE